MWFGFNRIFTAIAAAGTLLSVGAQAQTCADWSRSVPEPHVEATITGSLCRVAGNTVYVAGEELVSVGVTRWEAPSVRSRVPLPAPATDLVLDGVRAYVACGRAGVIELDIAEPAKPFITRSYSPGDDLEKVTIVRELIVALDGTSRLHFLATAADGDLAAISVYVPADHADFVAAVAGRLVLVDAAHLVALDLANPLNPQEVGRFDSYGGYLASLDDLAVCGTNLYPLGAAPGEDCEGDPEEIRVVRHFMVGPDGGISDAGFRQVGSRHLAVACTGGYLLAVGDTPRAFALDASSLHFAGILDLKGNSVDLEGDRLAAVGPDGLATAIWSEPVAVQPVANLVGEPAGPFGFPTRNTTYSGSWSGPYGMLKTSEYSYCDYHGGSAIRRSAYDICRIDDALNAEVVYSGSYADGYDYTEGGSNFAGDIYLAGHYGDRVMLRETNGYFTVFEVVDTRAHAIVGQYQENFSGEYTYLGGIMWRWSGLDGALERYDWGGGDPRTPTGRFPFAAQPVVRAPGPDLLLNVATDDIEVFDSSDPTRLVLMATLSGPSFSRSVRFAWAGYRYFTVSGSTLRSVDFGQPAAPIREPDVDLGFAPDNMAISGNRLAFRAHVGERYIDRINGFRIAEVPGPGGPVVVSPLIEASASDAAIVLTPNVAYISDGLSVRAFDISDLTRPTLIGSAVAGTGNLAIFGDDLAAGQVILPRDCHDLVPPQEITIDIKPVLKPRLGSRGHGTGQGVVPVVVLGDATFDVTTLDQASVRFGPAGAAPLHVGAADGAADPTAKCARTEDLDGDGDLDLMFKFRLGETGLGPQDTEATLTGRTLDGREVYGTDTLGTPEPHRDEGTTLALSPNPFNPETVIRYTLAKAGPARVAVYDVRGRRVALLADGLHAAGAHEAVWRGADDGGRALPSGTYFVRVEADGRVLTRKALLLK